MWWYSCMVLCNIRGLHWSSVLHWRVGLHKFLTAIEKWLAGWVLHGQQTTLVLPVSSQHLDPLPFSKSDKYLAFTPCFWNKGTCIFQIKSVPNVSVKQSPKRMVQRMNRLGTARELLQLPLHEDYKLLLSKTTRSPSEEKKK